MKPDMLNHMFNFLKEFMLCNSWDNGNVPQQAIAIFTTICVMGDIEADTNICDNMIEELYRDCRMVDVDMSYDDFYNFMVTWIV